MSAVVVVANAATKEMLVGKQGQEGKKGSMVGLRRTAAIQAAAAAAVVAVAAVAAAATTTIVRPGIPIRQVKMMMMTMMIS